MRSWGRALIGLTQWATEASGDTGEETTGLRHHNVRARIPSAGTVNTAT
jgi:hypothetical protein